MTLSTDFAVCPWCGWEDDTWPEYHNKPFKDSKNLICNHCKKPFRTIVSVEFLKIPVCEHDKKQFGDVIDHPICNFETRKMMR